MLGRAEAAPLTALAALAALGYALGYALGALGTLGTNATGVPAWAWHLAAVHVPVAIGFALIAAGAWARAEAGNQRSNTAAAGTSSRALPQPLSASIVGSRLR